MRLVQRDEQPVEPPSALAEGAGVHPVCEPICDHPGSASVEVLIPANAGSSSRLR